MQYRTFGKLDWQPSALGFGCMRLPTLNNDPAQIDDEQAISMVRYAIDHGVNYIDTAYPYHGGQSEAFVARALADGYREKVRIATKLPTWLVNSPADCDRYLNEQLERLQTPSIDFYLLHSLDRKRWEQLSAFNILRWAEGALADGRIRYLGFSFHDDYAAFQTIVDAYDAWTFCQIQHNYMDINEQAGTRGLRYAAQKGLAVVIMEPLLGGRLVNPPRPVQALWDTAPKRRSAADWALQWLWNQPEVSLVLSGMSTLLQVKENVASAEHAAIGSLTPAELEIVSKVRTTYKELCPIPCTRCRYCMPCPNGVNIPGVFAALNEGIMYEALGHARWAYKQWIPAAEQAVNCIQCRECEDKCPQHILISQWMPIVHAVMAEGQALDSCALP